MRLAVVVALALAPTVAHAQAVDRRFAEEPTDGVAMPGTPVAGDADARAVDVNPGGVALVRGTEVSAVLDVEDPDVATSSGQGFGLYAARPFGGDDSIVPRFGLGMGLEWLRPSRANLLPDPGEPFRFTLAYAQALGKTAGLGLSWHHFHDDGILEGVNTFDLGLSTRWGNYLALGATLRDIATSPIGGTPVQRRYELEAALRPLETDALELAVGGRIGETRGDVDGWARVSARVARGVYVHGQVETRALHEVATTAAGSEDIDTRDYRATLGVEISFGHVGLTALATGLHDETGANHALSGELIARASEVGPPSIAGEAPHIERIELEGALGVRELTQIVVRMRAIARDADVPGVVITFDAPTAGWSTFEELRGEVLRLRAAKKKVFAYMVSGTARDYLVASACDKIYVDPAGGLRVAGMAGTTIYFKGLFEHLGVFPQFEKIGEFKSAPEQFTEHGPTPAAAKMHDELYSSLWDAWLDAVGSGRHLTREQVAAIVEAGPYSAGQVATDARLADAVGPPDKISELVAKQLGGLYPVDTAPVDRPERWERPGIAIIYIDGDIVDGKSQAISILGSSTSGAETVVAALTAARENPNVGAVVLRIDSPGGSALASELIAREVFATRGVKPILCSMSDYAASGGYFVAAGCDVIYAEPMTITGSIGIFSGKFDISGLLAKLGIQTDTYRKGARADAEGMFRPYTDEERAVLLDKLRYAYSRFVGAVADGRKLEKAQVDAIGRGHVWTGAQALPLKLVDKLGGIGDAIADAKQRMGLPDSERVHLIELPARPGSPFGAVGKLLGVHADGAGAGVAPAFQLTDLPIVRDVLRTLPVSVLLAPDDMQARLPFQITWE
jgi:protease-4